MALGEIKLTRRRPRLKVARGGGDLRPGNGGGYRSNLLHLGPVVLSPGRPTGATGALRRPEGLRRALPKKRLDWIEVVKPASAA